MRHSVPSHLRLRSASVIDAWPVADDRRLACGAGKYRTPSSRYLASGKPGLPAKATRPACKRVRVKGLMI